MPHVHPNDPMKIIVAGAQSRGLLRFRGKLLQSMAEHGHEVIALAPEDRDDVRARLAAMGIEFRQLPMTRTGNDPLSDLRLLRFLYTLCRRERPDAFFGYTAKPVIFGTVAAALARVPLRVALISGRGSALSGGPSLGRQVLAQAMQLLYAIALRQAHLVFFQNPDDRRYFRAHRLVGRGQPTYLVDGSGVDLEEFSPAPLPEEPLTFLMMGRLVREKGLLEFLSAARRMKRAGIDARFQLLGSLSDPNWHGLDGGRMDGQLADGTVEYLGEADDVRPAIAGAHVLVLPSYYGEGVPRSLLEGLAMGRAIVTTSEPGCRETVSDGRNGYLVPARDPDALAEAMSRLVAQPDLVAAMGREGRRLAEARFDVDAVNRTILGAMGMEAPTDPTRGGERVSVGHGQVNGAHPG